MNEFPIPKDAYVAFDGLSIRDKIKERLNTTGIFTDQNYEGSNIAGFNDAIAMSFSLLMYYLNQNSANGLFSETSIYENINRIVQELGYKPIGHQTASVGFTMRGINLPAGSYHIPRYSSISIGGLPYSLGRDVSFTRQVGNDTIGGIDSDAVMFQGTYTEMPLYTPSGVPNEIVYITVDDSYRVDNFNIDVYVKTNGVWTKWSKTQSLFVNNSSDNVYELRFNQNQRYELVFGDGINGKQLSPSDQVVIYYLTSDGTGGEIGVGALANKKITQFVSQTLTSILQSTRLAYMSSTQMGLLSFNNKFPSTYYAPPESVASIRKNAPGIFRSQFSITTKKSYETFIRSNFHHIIHDVKVMNNTEYLDSYMKYFYDLGLTKPQNESRALFNQINFSDSCNFNNVYAFVVPKSIKRGISYLTPAQKTMIIDTIHEEKVLTSDTIPADPMFIAFDIGIPGSNTIKLGDMADTELVVVRSSSIRGNAITIKRDIHDTILRFFGGEHNTLGQLINIQQLNLEILNLEGVSQIFTRNRITDTILEGVQMINWNPVYFDLTAVTSSSVVRLQEFQFPYLYDTSFIDRITVR